MADVKIEVIKNSLLSVKLHFNDDAHEKSSLK